MERLKTIFASRYVHLTLGLFVLYGVASALTHTDRSEKIVDCLMWRAYADYLARDSESSIEALEHQFFKERYEERVEALTRDVSDGQDASGIQTYLLRSGLVYEVWPETEGTSYLLAPIIERGYYKREIPERVAFYYCILGDKRIMPWQEHKDGLEARAFVTVLDRDVYIHMDSLDYILERYFNLLWASDARHPEDLRSSEWDLTSSLSRDLQSVCEDVFIYRHYRNRKIAREYFVEEGFTVFLPMMLVMAARMVADRNAPFSPEYRYQRAYLTGLYLEPSYTMLSLLDYPSKETNPAAAELWNQFSWRLYICNPNEITLDRISETARQIFEELEDSHRQG
jgi:hypothetical protein